MPGQTVTLPDRRDDEINQYFVSLPPTDVDVRQGKRPLLLFLHGRGEARFNKVGEFQGLDAVKRHGSPPARCEEADWKQPFVVVAPQLPYWASRWHQPQHRKAVQQIIEKCIAEHAVDPGRVYSTGFSIGGLGVVSITLQTECRFAAVLSVDAYDPDPSWQDRTLSSSAGIGTRVASFHSRNNGVAAELVKLLNPNPVIQLRDGEHVHICKSVYGEDATYEWLKGTAVAGK